MFYIHEQLLYFDIFGKFSMNLKVTLCLQGNFPGKRSLFTMNQPFDTNFLLLFRVSIIWTVLIFFARILALECFEITSL